MSKLILITGVNGQDGSHMADYLLKNTDYEIRGMIRRSSKPDYSNIQQALKNPRFKLVIGDLGDSQSIDNLVKELKPDYFINFAAQSFVGSSWQIPEQTFDSGAMGVLRCLEAIRKHTPNCRFYNAGSSEEFGDIEYSPQDENHPPRPMSPYGAGKSAARGLVRVYRHSYNLYAIQGYLFNHEGTRRGEEFVTRKISKGAARIYHAIKNNQSFEPIELGNLDAKRDWSDSEDFIEGIWMMLNQEECRKDRVYKDDHSPPSVNWIKEYVLSSGETHTIREFVELAFKEAGIEGLWVSGAHPENEVYVRTINYPNVLVGGGCLVKIDPKFYRPAEVKLLLGDSSAARKDLGWKPKTSFQELVKKMIRNDINNYKE